MSESMLQDPAIVRAMAHCIRRVGKALRRPDLRLEDFGTLFDLDRLASEAEAQLRPPVGARVGETDRQLADALLRIADLEREAAASQEAAEKAGEFAYYMAAVPFWHALKREGVMSKEDMTETVISMADQVRAMWEEAEQRQAWNLDQSMKIGKLQNDLDVANSIVSQQAAGLTRVNEARLEDLKKLLHALGRYDGAQPLSPREVFDDALQAVRDLRADKLKAETDRDVQAGLMLAPLKRIEEVLGFPPELRLSKAVVLRMLDIQKTIETYWNSASSCHDQIMKAEGVADRVQEERANLVGQLLELLNITGFNPHTSSFSEMSLQILGELRFALKCADRQQIGPLGIERDRLEALQLGLADASCWMAGYTAALGDDFENRRPEGHWAVREMNVAIQRAMDRRPPQPMPF